jgi:hypothetical protein
LLSKEQGIFIPLEAESLPRFVLLALDVSEHLHCVSANSIDRDLFQTRMRYGSRDTLVTLPKLNPVAFIIPYWKQHELPNVCPGDYYQFSEAAAAYVARAAARDSSRPAGFFCGQNDSYYAGLNRTRI